MTAAAVSAAASDCGCAQVQGHSPLLRGAWVLLVLVLRARVSFSLFVNSLLIPRLRSYLGER
jgi:hypothetical protein